MARQKKNVLMMPQFWIRLILVGILATLPLAVIGGTRDFIESMGTGVSLIISGLLVVIGISYAVTQVKKPAVELGLLAGAGLITAGIGSLFNIRLPFIAVPTSLAIVPIVSTLIAVAITNWIVIFVAKKLPRPFNKI